MVDPGTGPDDRDGAPSAPDDPPGLVEPELIDAKGRPVLGTSGDIGDDGDLVPDDDEDGVAGSDADLVDPESDPRRNVIPRDLPAMAAPLNPSTSLARKGDLLAYYLAEVRRYPMLDPDEEREIAIRYAEEGDVEAAHRLVTANLRLVVKLAFQYHRQWANVLDLIQEGNVGLVEALSRYDPYRGIRFSSYAQYWIRAMILRFLMDNYRMVRLGSTRHGRKLFFQLKKEKERLTRELGARPSTKRLAEALDVPEKEVITVDQHMSAPALSLHQPVGASEGRSLDELVQPENEESPEDSVAMGELGAVVAEALRTFAESLVDDRERAIWYRRLTAQEPASLSKLGEEHGVSKERIRQVEARIKKRLKKFLVAELGDEIGFEFQVPEE